MTLSLELNKKPLLHLPLQTVTKCRKMRLFKITSNTMLDNPNIKCHHAHQKISEGLIEFLAQLSITIVTLFNYVGSMLDSISNCVVMSPEDTFEIISFFQLIHSSVFVLALWHKRA